MYETGHKYGLFETDRATDIVDIIRSPDFGGGSVTIPLKLDVMPLLDTIDPAAQIIGAVNTIVPVTGGTGKTTLTGYNTDWLGMVLALRNAGAHGTAGVLKEAGMVIGGTYADGWNLSPRVEPRCRGRKTHMAFTLPLKFGTPTNSSQVAEPLEQLSTH